MNSYLTNYHKSLDILLAPLKSQYESGSFLLVKNQIRHFYIYLTFGISDMKEARNACATYQSYKAKHPCYSCLVLHEDLSSVDNGLIINYRTYNNMYFGYQQGLTKKNPKKFFITSYI